MSAILEVKKLRCWIEHDSQTIRAVDGVEFSLYHGEILAILGESGCGKSMTAAAISKLIPMNAYYGHDSQILYRGENLLHKSESEMRCLRGKKIAMVFQDPMTALNPVLTIRQQIAESLNNIGESSEDDKIISLLEKVGIPAPKERLHQYPHELSGGMKQRVVIAIAIAAKPDILIADEPTTALDVTIQAQVLSLLQALQQDQAMSIILITHDLSIVRQFADRIAVMYAGHIIEIAATDTFFSLPHHPYSRYLLDALPNSQQNKKLKAISGQPPRLTEPFTQCRFLERCQQALPICRQKLPIWRKLTEKNGVRCHIDNQTPIDTTKPCHDEISIKHQEQASDVICDIQGLSVHYPIRRGVLQRVRATVNAVDDVSLQIKLAKTLAIVGESGSGKSTLAKALVNILPITSGTIHFKYDDSHHPSSVQMIFQDPFSSFNPRLTIYDSLSEGLVQARELKKSIDSVIQDLLDQVGLPKNILTRYPHQFSGGQMQRLAIARALTLKPRLLVLDEPTSALDVSIQAQILNLLKQLQQEYQMSYLFISHDMSVVDYMADEIAVMYLGRVVEQGARERVINNPCHPYTQALLAAVPSIHLKQELATLTIEGEQPSPLNPPLGCHFQPRCPKAMTSCREIMPSLIKLSNTQQVSCLLYEQDDH